MSRTYDFVIVGGGSAGCVLANRLSVEPATRVLVLEAGRPDYWWDVLIHMPAALMLPSGNRFYDWKYESEPEPMMNGRRVSHTRGKVLGGSSSINGMIFQRGNPLDYERWAADPGMDEWDYAHCLPYFKKMEDCCAGEDDYRGAGGPLVVERGAAINPLFGAFFEAVQQAGYALTDDVNGYRQEGFARFDQNLHRGRRLSAARAYLHPVHQRPNLDVVTRATVMGVRFTGRRATGVEYRTWRGARRTVSAGEVVLCGGAFNSPQLLQVSGVGGADHLRQAGVPLVHHLPGVGANLQDHLEVYVQHAASQPVSLNPLLSWHRRPWIGLQWLFRRGPGITNHFEGGGFARSNDEVAYPNLMFHFLPVAVRYDGSQPTRSGRWPGMTSGRSPGMTSHGYQVHVGPMYSDVRGSVRITSPDARVKPALRFNYLSTPNDRREWVEAIQVARRVLAQPAFAAFDAGEVSPGPGVSSDQQILDWVAVEAETALHPSCTCAMGTGERAVVDPHTMKVHGIEGLRVVDASVMPYVTNGNIYAPVMMIAEKAADVIVGNVPLAPLDVPFYRHSVEQGGSAMRAGSGS